MSMCRWLTLWLGSSLLFLGACEGNVLGHPPVSSGTDAAVTAADGGGREQDAAELDAGPSSDDAAVADAASDASSAADSGAPPPPPIVVFDPAPGGFVGPIALTLSSFADTDAKVYYTLDGSLPTTNSPAYADPITLAETTLVRALAPNADGKLVLVEAVFLALDPSMGDFSSDLPVLVVHMLDADVPDQSSRDWVDAVFSVFEPGSGRSVLNGPSIYTSRLGIKVRGRSTRGQPKHSFTIQLRDALGDDISHSLLGMPSESDWVLYAPYNYDRSMVRNAFSYQVARKMGRYAARTRFCEVFLESAGMPLTQQSYQGVYSLTERLTRGNERIPIAKLDVDDISAPNVSGGYIFRNDEPDAAGEEFSTARGKTFIYDTPNALDIHAEQAKYLKAYLESIERALEETDGIDPTTQTHYSDLIDVGSFIDAHIVNMLTKNPDSFELSEYFYKDRSGLLNAGPVWDIDLGMAAFDPWGDRSQDPTHWGPGSADALFYLGFYDALFNHPEFTQSYWDRWHEMLDADDGLFNTTAFDETLDGYHDELLEAEARNRIRWPDTVPRNDSLGAEIDAIKAWLALRLTWIEANLDATP